MHSYKTDLFTLCESVPEINITFNTSNNHYGCYNLCINVHYL